MTTFARITSIEASRPQLYRARLAAEATGDLASQNVIESVIDAVAWPMAAGGIACAAGFPGVLAAVACIQMSKPRKESAR